MITQEVRGNIEVEAGKFRSLLWQGKSISEGIIIACLEIFYTECLELYYLNLQFCAFWKSGGWQQVKCCLNHEKGRRQTSTKTPGLNDWCIIFLVHENHWVAVVWRKHVNNEIVFYYADDMNCESTAREEKHYLKEIMQTQSSTSSSKMDCMWCHHLPPS